jgi:hypothetical protein
MMIGIYHQEETESEIEMLGIGIGANNIEAAGGEHNCEGDPESTIRGESCGTERVSNRHFPGRS